MTKEDKKIYNTLYYQRNKEIFKEKQREYSLKNKEHVLKEKAEYYQKNKEYIKEKRKEYYLKNKKRLQEYSRKHSKEYIKNNPHIINVKNAKRRARKNQIIVENVNQNIIKTFYKMSNRLTKCLGFQWHVDHLVPLSNGGSHHQNNLLPVPAIVNLSRKKNTIDFSHPFYSHLNF